ncbi:modular serine protease isoform X2 [Anabrus simplex]|uniref:modular serine protease isoform X2 n=1 Tax=Anabrus simplex TaxID=316456 RepID=UPI0035A26BAC
MGGGVLHVLLIVCVAVQWLPTSYSASLLDNQKNSSVHRSKRQSCRTRDFRCNNGACIDSTLMCDGAVDCPDGSDETSQTCLNTIVCPSYAFRCDYGGCVDADAKCNGKTDCADGSDERGCKGSGTDLNPSVPNNCKSGEFQCSSGQCIDIILLCDGNKDCKDGSDETKDSCGTFSCPGFAFRCAYGACIDGDGRCNGQAQCADASDESPDICGDGPVPVPPRPTTTATTTLPPPSSPKCTLPQPPQDGMYVVGGCTPPNCPTPGTKLQFAFLNYTCNPGFSITGTRSVYCQDGMWFSQPPTCSRVSCSPLESISRDVTCTFNRDNVPCGGRMSVGTVANIKCKDHYQQVPELFSYQTVCNSNGKWSREISSCIPVCGVRNPEGVPFVSNGVKTKFGEFPWHVGVYRLNDGKDEWEQICGGTLISSRVVISAAHCFYDEDTDQVFDKNLYKIVAGKYFRDWEKKNKYLQEGKIENIIVHEMYKGKTLNYESDIAVINLQVEIVFNLAVRPVCLDREKLYMNYQLSAGNVGAVVGWGVNENMEPSEELITAYLPYVDYQVCYRTVPESFRQFLRKDKFCAGHLNGTSVCPGDSGGGLAFPQESELGTRWYLQGIVSVGVPPKGANKCFDRQYSAFTRVADYYNFISENMIR